MYRCIAKLKGAFIDLATPGVDPDILSLCVVGIHAAQRRQPQTAISFDFGNHGTQGVSVGRQHQATAAVLSA